MLLFRCLTQLSAQTGRCPQQPTFSKLLKQGRFDYWRALQKHNQHAGHLERAFVCSGMAEDTGVQQVLLPPVTSEDALGPELQLISSTISSWLDDEWTPLAIHKQLGEAAAQAYREVRLSGETEMGSILLALSSKLLDFNYRDTFVNAFEVSNKVVEILMLDMGTDVCCTTDEDKQRVQRQRQQL